MYVNLPRKLEGPRAPNIEFDDPPPNADPKSEPFPCWSNTTAIITIASRTDITVKKIIIIVLQSSF